MKYIIDCSEQEELTVRDSVLTDIELINTETSILTSLTLDNLVMLSNFNFIKELSTVRTLKLKNLPRLPPNVEFNLAVSDLSLINLPRFKFLSSVNKLPNLLSLALFELPSVMGLSGLNKFNTLKALYIRNLQDIVELNTVSNWGSIEVLSLVGLPKLYSLKALYNSLSDVYAKRTVDFNLTQLELADLPNIKDLGSALKNSNVKRLSIYGMSHLSNLTCVATIKTLEELHISELDDDCLLGELRVSDIKVLVNGTSTIVPEPHLPNELFVVGDFKPQ